MSQDAANPDGACAPARSLVLALFLILPAAPAVLAQPSERGTEGTKPLSAQESLRALRTRPGLEVQLVAAEPLIESPVAIDWGADGRLWVCEMRDYPTGMDEQWKAGGRIKVLRDSNGDGRFDQGTVFLDGLPFPTGVTAWRKGALVCAAPDILYAEDTDGDGKADKVEKLFSGFHTDNYQARVNSLSLGLDNWIYGANGLLGGVIRGVAGGTTVDIRNRDFRFRPGTSAFEPVSGLTQQGRVRDDWGNWFGCDNSRALLHFPLPDHYLRRNPHVSAPEPIVVVPRYAGAGSLFPVSRMLERFNDPHAANRVTSGCGLGLYRDTLLGEGLYGNAFTCEPVHNLVHREVLSADGLTFASRRADDEGQAEFLASTDHWFRPAQVRTGPDGALYVVDMYRFLIEHPRWIPAARLAKIDVRAGAEMGRIYRVVRKETPLRAVRDLTRLSPGDLAAALDSPNGTERDRVHLELLARGDTSAAGPLRRVARQSALPQARVQAWSTLEGLGGLEPEDVRAALGEADPRSRANAVRLAESFLRAPATSAVAPLLDALLMLVADPDLAVRAQLAFTLGESRGLRAGEALGRLAVRHLSDARFRAAVLSSAGGHVRAVLAAVLAAPVDARGRNDWIAPLVRTAAGSGDDTALASALASVLPAAGKTATGTHFAALASVLEALDGVRAAPDGLPSRSPALDASAPPVARTLASARRVAEDTTVPVAERESAIRLLGRPAAASEDLRLLCGLATAAAEEPMRKAAFAALRRVRQPEVADRLLGDWPKLLPACRAEVLALLLTRAEWTLPLLRAVQGGAVQAGEFPPADRERLTRSPDARLQALAGEVLAGPARSARAEVLAGFQGALQLTGEPARGAEMFARLCATCHALGGLGHAVGPDLAPLREKDADYWLKNILDPNAAIEPRYVNYLLETKDGRSLSGVIRAETSTGLTLLATGGVTETVPRSDIREVRASALSLMPEGLEQGLTGQAMADLIAFLKSKPTR